jgi:hypothetical protein
MAAAAAEYCSKLVTADAAVSRIPSGSDVAVFP